MWDKHQIVEEPYDGKLSRTVLKPSWGSDAPAQVNYNYKLRCFIVTELKTGRFKAEYISKLGLYVSAVNHQMKHKDDNPTIGLLICKTKDEVVAKYTLENTNQPIGMSEYQLVESFPKDFRSSLPSIEEIEKELQDE